MRRISARLLIFSILFLVLCTGIARNAPTLAYDPNATGSAVVSATVISSSFGPPILIAPNDNSATNNPREPLVWQRPDPLPATPLHHYDVYLDGSVFAASISDSITQQDYYFYTITRVGDTFHLYFKTDLAQGYHTWSVVAYDSYGTSSGSVTRTFYLDSSIPILTLQKVDHQTLGWTTADLTTIPDIDHRLFTVTTSDPLLKGTIEANANMQFYLICPQNIHFCTDQFYTGVNSSGTWQHRFYNLEPGLIYTVFISATDAGGNSVALPELYLRFGIPAPVGVGLAPTLIQPLPATSEPTPSPEIITPPIIFHPLPPAAPKPPVFKSATIVQPLKIENWLLILLLLGLPLHLLMSAYGTKIRFFLLPKFLFVLFFPFIGKKNFQTVPFTTIEMFDPDKLDHSWQTKISNINGFYNLKSPIPEKLFVKITCADRTWKNIIINGKILPSTCLIPLLQDPQTPSNRLRRRIMTTRRLPLTLAVITSAISLYLSPNYFNLIYLYLSLQLVFSEYLYPRLSK